MNARHDAGTGLADISYAAFADTDTDPDPEGQNCANGIYAGYCGTQKSNTGLYIAVGFGGQIIGTKNPLAENAEFFWFAVTFSRPPSTAAPS